MPIHEKIEMENYNLHFDTPIIDFPHGNTYNYAYPIASRGHIFGYIIFSEKNKREIPRYIKHILRHLSPLFIQIIEGEWKRYVRS